MEKILGLPANEYLWSVFCPERGLHIIAQGQRSATLGL